MVKIFIPSKNRYNTISTHLLFPEAQVVVHHAAQAGAYKAGGVANVIISDTLADEYGLTRQREWVCNNLVEPGEWFLFADDNIQELWAIPFPHYADDNLREIEEAMGTPALASVVNKYRPKNGRVMSPEAFLKIVVPECIAKAEEVGARMVGFSVTDNPLFRTKKWGTTSYVSGKMFLLKNGSMTWNHEITMEDFRNSAYHLARYGRVVINRYIHPRAIHYQPGGMGTAEERIPFRERDIESLMVNYPGLFRRKKGEYPDLSIRIHGEKHIDKWRASL